MMKLLLLQFCKCIESGIVYCIITLAEWEHCLSAKWVGSERILLILRVLEHWSSSWLRTVMENISYVNEIAPSLALEIAKLHYSSQLRDYTNDYDC